MNDYRRPHSLFFPLLLVAAGILILLINMGSLPGTVWQNLVQYWPVIFIIAGLDGLYKRDGWVGPLVLLGLGTVLLLGNLHYIAYSGFSLLLRLWPILLVAIGLDVILGHRASIWSNLIRVALGIALIGGIVWLATVSPYFSMGMKSVPFEQSLDKATSSEVRFSVAVGELYLGGGADKNVLVSGTAGLPKEMSLDPVYVAPKNGKSQLTVAGNDVVILPVHSSVSPWEFDLNSDIPIDLSSEIGVGEMRVNLSDTKVSEFESKMGIGYSMVTLPDNMDVNAHISGAIGEMVIRIPSDSEVLIKVDNGIVNTVMPAGYTRTEGTIRSPEAKPGADKINLNVDLAIGSLVIQETN